MLEWLDVLKETLEDAQDEKKKKKKNKHDGTKHPWTKAEDDLLRKLIKQHGAQDWSTLASKVSSSSACRLLSRRYVV